MYDGEKSGEVFKVILFCLVVIMFLISIKNDKKLVVSWCEMKKVYWGVYDRLIICFVC